MTRERVAIILAVAAAVLIALLAQGRQFAAVSGAVFGNVAGIEVPALDDPAMIRRGAAHYERVCARCHASPDRPDQNETLDVSPSPPKLHLRAEAWSPEALFATIKHGIAGSGMPAWPAQHRDDEIWSMVAFVTRLPGMEPAAYRELAGLTTATAELPAPLVGCARCHGPEGRGTPDGAFPRLDLQSPEYLYQTLLAFREARRESGFMQSAVSGLRDDELRDLADHFGRSGGEAAVAMPPATHPPDGPACTACHGPPSTARAEFPALAGQYEAYLLAQLKLLADRERPRGGGPFIELMREAAHALSQQDMETMAKWYAAQPVPEQPRPSGGTADR